ncbi:MAG TPA: histidine kinase [Anaerolineales bacterium]|nr:histidine kinase [Anaerolineales bacterium]
MTAVFPDGPAHGLVQVGDVLTAINGQALFGMSRPYFDKAAGDTVALDLIDLDERARVVTVALATVPAWHFVQTYLAFYLVALAIWITGVVVVLLVDPRSVAEWDAQLYFAFCQLTTVIFSLVQLGTSVDIVWDRPYVITATWLSIISLLLHLRFPRAWLASETSRRLALGGGLIGLAITAFDLSIVDVTVGWARQSVTTLWLLPMTVVAIAALIIVPAPADRNDDTRRARATVALFAALGIGPFLFLSVGRLFWGLHPSDPLQAMAESTIIFLPIGYGYAILRHRFIKYGGTISRAVGYLVAVLGLAGTLGLAGLGLSTAGIGAPGAYWALGGIAVALAITFEPTRRGIQPIIDRAMVGQIDVFRSTLRGVAYSLDESTDLPGWAEGLCAHFARALNTQPVGLLLRTPQGRHLQLAAYDPNAALGGLPAELDPLAPLIARLGDWGEPATAADLRSAIEVERISHAERAWLESAAIDLWWPIQSAVGLHGVVVIGRKPDGFGTAEMELLSIAVRQIAAVLDNIQYSRELKQLSRAALQTRDAERRRVSRDLDDQIIQPLVSLNFALSAARDLPVAADARSQVAELIAHVRRISADLRPPALDEVGLAAAARGLVRAFSRAHALPVDFIVRPSDDLDVGEPLASAFFGALREGLNNIGRHAGANRVSVLLELQADRLLLVIHDDGCGFQPPARLGQLAPAGHFGLLGLQERLAAVGGSLEIHSEPGKGTRVECQAHL